MLCTTLQFFLSDINECNDPSTCVENQVCFNTAGSYLCECDLGYERDPDSGTTSPGVYQGCKGVLFIIVYYICGYMYMHIHTYLHTYYAHSIMYSTAHFKLDTRVCVHACMHTFNACKSE